jgi:phage terminase Nu1 subunit (DNA packaging protein)
MSEHDWLEGGSESSDRGGRFESMTKTELAEATGLTITALDRLVRDGAPVAKRGASRKEGLRFGLPAFFEWYVERVASRRAAAGTAEVTARERAQVALATLREYQIAEKQRALVNADEVNRVIADKFTEIRVAIESLSSQVTNLSDDQRSDLDDAIRDMLIQLSGGQSELDTKIRLPRRPADGKDEVDDTMNGSGAMNAESES